MMKGESAMQARTAATPLNRETSSWRTLPNALTVFRIALIVPFAWLCVHGLDLFALGVFLLAGITDVVDGTLARVFHQKSKFGRLADPLADKLLTTTAFVALCFFHRNAPAIPAWIAIPVVLRDVFILLGCVIVYLVIHALPFQARAFGKANTLIEITTIVCFLASSRIFFVQSFMRPLYMLLLASLILSAGDYLAQGLRIVRERG